jgi:sulfhydrogenase subunit beta (sulfur reductase)
VSGEFHLPKPRLDELIAMLWRDGYRVMGPVERDGSVAFDEVRSMQDLPIARREEQSAGRYRIADGRGGEVFGVVNGAGSLKPSFFAPEETLLEIRRERRGFSVTETEPAAQRLAFIGVRACDLAAVAIQDRVFLQDAFRDSHYAARRKDALMIAVNCTRSAETCFCASMNTGPQAGPGHDLAMTEMDDGFVVRCGSERGEAVVAALGLAAADTPATLAAGRAVEHCAENQRRRMDTSDLPQLLYEEAESPRWSEVSARCLSCTNCTMVCPTCFCHTVLDTEEIAGNLSRRVRKWDSCFSLEHAHIHGINFRSHTRDRYRQWLTHKLASWIDQFGSSGCTGCGRCITWCPVGIDLTEEVAAIRSLRGKRESR